MPISNDPSHELLKVGRPEDVITVREIPLLGTFRREMKDLAKSETGEKVKRFRGPQPC
jgi:hypothetical protein